MLEHKVELSRLPPLESGIETTEIDLRLSESCPTGAAMPYRTVILSLVFIASWAAAMSQTTATEHTLKPTPKMVAWGYYDAKAAPVLRVKSGDTVPSLSSASSVNSAFSALGLFRVISPDLALPSPRTEKPEWCKPLPRPEYKSLQRVLQDDPWFEVYKVAPGVFALYEPHQSEEAISYLIVGHKQSLLFDTWLAISNIRKVTAKFPSRPAV